jgi:hypothetical protein
MSNRWISDLVGTAMSYLKIGFAGVRLKNSSGNLLVRNSGDSADAQVTTSQLNNSGDLVVINSDAASTGADWKLNLRRATSGMTGDVDFKFPPDDGTANYVLQTDGSGNTSWVSAGSTSNLTHVDTTSLAFGSTSPVTMFTLPANAVITNIQVLVDTAFDGSATMSVGVSGTTSKYVSSTQVDLTTTGVYEINPGLTADAGTNALIITYSATSPSVGAARVLVEYSIPS